MGPLSQVSGFTFVVNPLTAMICTGFFFFHEPIAGRTPTFACRKNFSAARIDRAKRVHRFSHHRFFADLNRQTLRAESFAYDKRGERLNLVGHLPGLRAP